jgi:hypothetical protein
VQAYGPDPDHPADDLAPERTELAWNRSGLAVFVCAAVLVRRIWPLESPERLLAAAVIGLGIALWATALLVAGHRATAAPRLPGVEFRRMMVATLAFAAGGFAVSFFPPA